MNSVIFLRIGSFEAMFSLQVKDCSQPYPVPSRRVVYVLQELIKEDLNGLKKLQMIVPLGVGETSDWLKNFVLIPKVNGKV